jgi:dTDP-4-dehydrorhamnose reductase
MDDFLVDAADIAENPFKSHPNLSYKRVDLTDFELFRPELDSFKPDVVFNCAAYTDVDGCEKNKDLARLLNVSLVGNLLNTGTAKVIQFSTDYVFNGESGPYAEDDDTDPVGYYGRTKLESERLVASSGRDFLIIRTNVLFGYGKNIRHNFITWLIRSLKEKKKLRIVTDQFNNPIHADNLAAAAIEVGMGETGGILHIAGASYLSRYEMAIKTAGHFGLDPGLIEPVTTAELGQAAGRPLKGGLKIDLAMSILKTELLTFEPDGLDCR